MKLHYFDKKSLNFKPLNMFKVILLILCSWAIIGLSSFTAVYHTPKIQLLTPEEKLIVINEYNDFSQDKLILEIQRLNLKYPHIVLAQSILETGEYKSYIFKSNNNLFGMKQAARRPSTAVGTNRNHAIYETWKESLYDYALFQCKYTSSISTEQQYYDFLKSYAEDSLYRDKLQNIINKYNLHEKFKYTK